MTKRATKKPSKRPTAASSLVGRTAGSSGATQVVAAARRQSHALAPSEDARFAEVVALIEAARNRAYQAVNTELVSLYWQLGEHISRKIASAEWGDGVVDELAATLARRYPGLRGYTRRNLFRMRQFYEAYRHQERVSPLVTQLPWTHHLIILGQAKPAETREFYILAAIKEHWSSRELERQVQSGAILRSAPGAKKVSAVLTQIHRPRWRRCGRGCGHGRGSVHHRPLRPCSGGSLPGKARRA
jgi:predicted nuclease of restriction endonuclease-like (RecB) superfamily